MEDERTNEACLYYRLTYPKFPKYSVTQKFVVITLKFELCGSTIKKRVQMMADGMAKSVDPDQTAHCLPRHICPKT